MDFTQKPISQKKVFEGKIVSMRVDQAEMPDGQVCEREVVEHVGGVGIALKDSDGKFWVVKQWRYAQSEVMLEFPAGKMEKGEDPLETAQREIIEETGYKGKNFLYLGKIVPTPAYDEEVIHMYYAEADGFVGQHLDSDEFVEVSKMSLEELTQAIVKGECPDAKTIAMVFLLKERKLG